MAKQVQHCIPTKKPKKFSTRTFRASMLRVSCLKCLSYTTTKERDTNNLQSSQFAPLFLLSPREHKKRIASEKSEPAQRQQILKCRPIRTVENFLPTNLILGAFLFVLFSLLRFSISSLN